MNELTTCDSLRVQLIQCNVESEVVREQLSEKEQLSIKLQREVIRLGGYSDSLEFDNMSVKLNAEKDIKLIKRSRRWWTATAIAGVLGAVAVHLHWKYADNP